MEILVIKIECVYGCYLEDKAAKICEIQGACKLEELCDFILESFEFDDDHLHEFFIARKPVRSNKLTIDDELLTLNKIMPIEKGLHLFMHFDFGDDWIFKITQNRKKAVFKKDLPYPRVVEHIGKNPVQYPLYEE